MEFYGTNTDTWVKTRRGTLYLIQSVTDHPVGVCEDWTTKGVPPEAGPLAAGLCADLTIPQEVLDEEETREQAVARAVEAAGCGYDDHESDDPETILADLAARPGTGSDGDYTDEDRDLFRRGATALREAREIASEIEAESERQVIAHLGHAPRTWYTGGSEHNDDRLRAEVEADGSVSVTDGDASETYAGDLAGIPEYVADWLDTLWSDREED